MVPYGLLMFLFLCLPCLIHWHIVTSSVQVYQRSSFVPCWTIATDYHSLIEQIINQGQNRIILLSNFTPVSHSPSVLCCAPVHQSPVVKAIIPVQRTLSVHIYLLVWPFPLKQDVAWRREGGLAVSHPLNLSFSSNLESFQARKFSSIYFTWNEC